MARTLTASATTAKESQALRFDVLVESETLNLRYSFSTTTAGGYSWEQRIVENGLGDIVYQVPPGGGIASVSTLRIVVIDDGTGQSPSTLIDAFGHIRGADLSLSILLNGEAYADKIAIYAGGVIADHKRDGMLTELIAVDGTFHADRLLPLDIVPQNDPSAANSAIGRALPLLYGDGTSVVLAPMLLTDESVREYKAAGHGLRTISADTYAIYLPSANLAKSRTGDATSSTSAATMTLTKSLAEMLFSGSSGTLTVAREQAVTNSSLTIDTISTTRASIATSSATDAFGEGYGFLGIAGAWASPEGSDVLQYQVLSHKGSSGAAATLNAALKLRLTDSGGVVLRDDLDRGGDFRWFTNYRDWRKELRGILLEGNQKIELLIEAYNEGGVGTSSEFWEVGEVTMTLGAQAPGNQTPLYLFTNWQGRADDAVGTYTGTAFKLIQNPADIIHNVMGEDLDITVDTASMSSARTRLSGWTFDGGLGAGWYQERESARSFFNRLAVQGKGVLFPGPNGIKFLPFQAADISQYDFDSSTILWATGTNPDTMPESRVSTFRLNQPNITQIWNSFEVRYNYNAGARKFDSLRYANPDGTNSAQSDASELTTLCINSSNRYGRSDALTIEADFIYDDNTADFLLDHLVRYFWDQRIVAEWETGTQGLHLEVGDAVTVDYADLPTPIVGAKFELHEIRYRFVPVTGTHGNNLLSFRVSCTASRILGVDFNFFAIRDQSRVVWYGLIPVGQTLGLQDTVPSQPGLIAKDLTPGAIPYWLKIEAYDTPGTFLYIYPDDITQTWIVDTAAPAVGFGWDVGSGLTLRSIDGVLYTVKAHSAQFIAIDLAAAAGTTKTANVLDEGTTAETFSIDISGITSDAGSGLDSVTVTT